jgi:hypothetical protein
MYTESGKCIQNLSRKIKGKDHLDLDVDGRYMDLVGDGLDRIQVDQDRTQWRDFTTKLIKNMELLTT